MKTKALTLTYLPQHPNIYSTNPSIQQTQGQAGAQFIRYSTDCTYTYVLTSNFLLLLLYSDCRTNHWSIQFGYLLHLLVQVIRVLFCVFWSLHSWRSWCHWWQMVRIYQNDWCADILEGLFDHVPEICLFQWWSFFLVQSKTSLLGITIPRCLIISGFLNWLTKDERNFAVFDIPGIAYIRVWGLTTKTLIEIQAWLLNQEGCTSFSS